MYEAIVARISSVYPIEGADRIQAATVSGYTVVLGKEHTVGELGVFFGPDGQLSREFCLTESLYRKHPETGAPMGGYMDENRRVRTMKFKKVLSEGLWIPLDRFKWAGEHTFTEGETFTHINDKLICEKYYSPAVRQHLNKGAAAPKAEKLKVALEEHYDTAQVRNNLHIFEPGDILRFTEKLHGTSGRTGNVRVTRKLRWWETAYNKLASLVGLPQQPDYTYQVYSGTRRVTLSPGQTTDKGYYEGASFRHVIHRDIAGRKLHQGETLYYEIVGYNDGGGSIMGTHKMDPKTHKEFLPRYGETITYRYGQAPATWGVYVYRITQETVAGTRELSWAEIVRRCEQLQLKVVPTIHPPIVFGEKITTKEELVELLRRLGDGPSTLDSTHPREGVCVLRETHTSKAYKWKGWLFSDLEGIRKNDDSYVDAEEIA